MDNITKNVVNKSLFDDAKRIIVYPQLYYISFTKTGYMNVKSCVLGRDTENLVPISAVRNNIYFGPDKFRKAWEEHGCYDYTSNLIPGKKFHIEIGITKTSLEVSNTRSIKIQETCFLPNNEQKIFTTESKTSHKICLQDSAFIIIDPSYAAPAYVFQIKALQEKDPINFILKSNMIYDLLSVNHYNGYYDSRFEVYDIETITSSMIESRILSPLDKIKDIKKLMAKEKIHYNDQGDVIYYYCKDTGVHMKRIDTKNSEYDYDYRLVTYTGSKITDNNIISDIHIYGNDNHLIVDNMYEAVDEYISDDNTPIMKSLNYTHKIYNDSMTLIYTIRDGIAENMDMDECKGREKRYRKEDWSGKVSKYPLNRDVAVYDNGIALIQDRFVNTWKFTFNNQQPIYEITYDNDLCTTSYQIPINKSVFTLHANNIKYTNAAGINYSGIIEIGTHSSHMLKSYKDDLSYIEFDTSNGSIKSAISDVYSAHPDYVYIRDKFGVPHKYTPNTIGFWIM